MSISQNLATSGKINQPDLANTFEYHSDMANNPNNSKAVLWANIETLMKRDFGKINVLRFHQKTKLSLGTIQRIKEQETNVGIDVLDQIAQVYDLQPWHLLTPGLDPANPPLVLISEVEKKFYASVKESATAFANIGKRAPEEPVTRELWVEGMSEERRKVPRD